MSEKLTKEELMQAEQIQEEKDHNHGNPTAAALTVHIVASQGVLNTKLHQYHWFVKGTNFYTLHEKFEELYDDNAKYYDEIAERLIASGSRPPSTTEQNVKHSLVQEDGAKKYLSGEKMVEDLVDDFRTIRDITARTIMVTQKEEDTVLEDLLIGYKGYLDKTIWMLQAFLGKEALEDDDAFEDDDE